MSTKIIFESIFEFEGTLKEISQKINKLKDEYGENARMDIDRYDGDVYLTWEMPLKTKRS